MAAGDNDCTAAIALGVGQVQWYLMAAYAYQVLDETLISDELWDKLCLSIDRDWDGLTHPHRRLVQRDALSSGTSMYLSRADCFPTITRDACRALLDMPPN